jgi:hypothetical protein
LKFDYPINVICFNRPHLLRIVLDSIKAQTIPISEDQLYFWVDGYAGSKDESLNQTNRNHETVSIIKNAFPKSQVHLSERNLGIARNYWRAELNSFENLEATSAFFLEEDIVLSPHYFELLMRLDSYLSANSDVSQLSVTGDIAANLSEPDEYFQTSGHSWGYLLRSWHHFERKAFLETYLSLLGNEPYYLKVNLTSEILDYFHSKGVLIAGISQDSIKDGLKNYFGRISVSTLEPWAQNIGTYGEHSEGATAHHNRKITQDTHRFPRNFDLKNVSRLLVDGRKKTIVQATHNYSNKILWNEYNQVLNQYNEVLSKYNEVLNSSSWKFTKPFRFLSTLAGKLNKWPKTRN